MPTLGAAGAAAGGAGRGRRLGPALRGPGVGAASPGGSEKFLGRRRGRGDGAGGGAGARRWGGGGLRLSRGYPRSASRDRAQQEV